MGSINFRPTLSKVKIEVLPAMGCRNGGTSPSSVGVVGGEGSISGRVLENGLSVSRRVMLYERATGAYAGQARSDKEGNYIFKRTNENLLYFVVSIDDSNDGVQYNLVGQDLISGDHDARINA